MSMFDKAKKIAGGLLATAPVAAPLAITADAVLNTNQAHAEGVQHASKISCTDAAARLANYKAVDLTNAKQARADLIAFFNKADPINAELVKATPEFATWEQPSAKYKHGRVIVNSQANESLNQMLGAAQTRIAESPEFRDACAAPAQQAEIPQPELPQFVAPNASLKLEGLATVGGTYKETKQYDMATGSAELGLNVVVTDERGNLLYGGGLVNMTLPTDLNLDSSIAVPGLNAEADGLLCYGGRAGVGTTLEGGHQLRAGAKFEHCEMKVDFTYEGEKIGQASPEGNFISGEVMYVSPNNIVVSGSAGMDPETEAKKAELRIGVKTDLLGGRSD